MRPVLFHWRKRAIQSYPAMLYIGLVAGVIAGNIAAHAYAINPLRTYITTIILLIPALAGARLQFVLNHWPLYRRNMRRVWDRREGGCSMYGGLALAILISVPLLRLFRLGFGAFWDVAIFVILVGMMFTRIGCLLNGCCAGVPSETWLSAYLPNCQGVWRKRIPSQMLEAGLAATLLVVALLMRRVLPFPGALFLLVAAGYASGRFLLEFLREREPGTSRFTWDHSISLVTLLSSISILAVCWPK